ncbi:MAG: PCI domain-containing protein [Candidatus Bathyarchaeia archaeon]
MTSILIQFIFFIFAAIVVSRLSKYIENERLQISSNLDNEIVGTINIYGTISLQELSGKFGMKVDEVEKWIAKLSAERKFYGVIDKDTMRVHSIYIEQEGRLLPQISSTKVIESKSEKLKKLEELFKEGRISEQAYTQLKKEYENE